MSTFTHEQLLSQAQFSSQDVACMMQCRGEHNRLGYFCPTPRKGGLGCRHVVSLRQHYSVSSWYFILYETTWVLKKTAWHGTRESACLRVATLLDGYFYDRISPVSPANSRLTFVSWLRGKLLLNLLNPLLRGVGQKYPFWVRKV